MSTAKLAITMGDPAGVGPEVIVKALAALPAEQAECCIVVGDKAALLNAARICGTDAQFAGIEIDDVAIPGGTVEPGKLSSDAGEAGYRAIVRAVELAMFGEVDGIVTAPINKAALNAAGHHHDGHTGLLTALTGATQSRMLLASDRLNVVHNSTHLSLRDAIDRAEPQRLLDTIRIGHAHFQRLGIARPRIAVAGLNPHCGEGGLFGDEDDRFVRPAVEAAIAEGIDADGPIAADTVFHRAYHGAFDLVVALYHDQGHIPIKLVAFDTAVNVTLGLPIDRTSVDHGTAFDIAGKGSADHGNMIEAISYAMRLAESRPTVAGASGKSLI